jgi:arylsulfatase A-like enzyme
MSFRRLLSLLTLGLAASLATAADQPNIIIVLADDQGFGDVTANNPASKIATPHLDRLAREGMRFTDAHTSSGVCTPTRYSLLTGRYHWRTRLQQGVLGGFSTPLIAKDRLTLAGFLKQQGYHTACIGKWHLGMNWPLRDGGTADDGGNFGQPFADTSRVDYTRPIQDGPVDRGFDHFYGISASLDMFPFVWINDRLPTESATVEKTFLRKGPAGAKFEAIDVQGGIIDHTLGYIRERAAAARQGKPFFAYVPLAAPHTPIVPTAEWQGKSGINPYADFVKQVDADIGRLLDALEQTGLDRDTLIVFTSDNGCSPAANIDELLAAGHHPNHHFRGHKADLYEGGHRVPFLVRWPARVRPGSTSSHIVGQIDFMATFADMLDATLPATAGEDSVSFLPILLDAEDAAKTARTSIISQSINGSFAIRDGPWKLALCPGSGGWSPPRPGKDDASALPEFQLYNLDTDPGETQNLIASHPDRVARMRAALETAIARGRTTPGPDLANDTDILLIKPHGKPASAKAKGKAKSKSGSK